MRKAESTLAAFEDAGPAGTVLGALSKSAPSPAATASVTGSTTQLPLLSKADVPKGVILPVV